MSIINIRSTTNLAAAISYQEHGRDGKQENRAPYKTCSCEPLDFLKTAKELMSNSHRKVEAFTLVQSFSRNELDCDNDDDVRKAHQAGVELCSRLSEKYHIMFNIETHIDSKGHCVHNHIDIPNVDLETQKALQGEVKLWQNLSRINDNVMRDMHLEVCNEKQQSGYDFKKDLQQRLDDAISHSYDFDTFVLQAAARHIVVHDKKRNGQNKKNITYEFTDDENVTHKIRDTKLADYNRQAVNRAIQSQLVQLDESLAPREQTADDECSYYIF